MGRGNYTEDDVKNCARAFTGWGLKRTVPGFYPYGHFDLEFEFHPDKHDDGEKTVLGETGNFDGPDVIDVILRQPATATFIARRLYQFFVSDTPDADAIELPSARAIPPVLFGHIETANRAAVWRESRLTDRPSEAAGQ